MKELLKKMSSAVGISGSGDDTLETVKTIFEDYNVSIDCDKMGSIRIFKKGSRKGVVWMSAHIDEIGLIVKKIEDGYIRFGSIGGYDEKILLGQEVTVFGNNQYDGIIGCKPPHYMERDEYDKMLGFKDLYIDTGMNEETVNKNISVGDRIIIKHKYTELKNDNVATKATDNRACASVIIKALQKLTRVKDLPDIYAVLNAQEETTFLGAATSSYDIHPDIAFVLDVTLAGQPGVENGNDMDEIAIGKGAHISGKLFEYVKKQADASGIKYAIEPLPRGSGTDTGAIQTARGGTAAQLISIPVRNMHSPVEVVNVKNMEKAADFLADIIKDIDIDKFDTEIIK